MVCLKPILNLPDNFDVTNSDCLRDLIPIKDKPVFPIAVTITHKQFVTYIANGNTGWRKFFKEPATASAKDFIKQKR